ncbi:MAG: DUF1829 domain-containing protein [Bacillota bacterium]
MTASHQLIDSYLAWLKAKLSVKDLGGTLEITTPFLDRHNDRLQIYVKEQGADLVLTDGGYILSDLSISGVDIQSDRRRRILTSILNGFGVQLEGEALVVKAKASSFPQQKHALLQAMLSVNDMFMTARSTVVSLFLEEVQEFLRENEIRHVASVHLPGKSGFSHRFSFVIPASRRSPERVVEPINIPDRNRIEPLLFSWSDTRETRQPDTVLYALLNDTERRVSPAVLSALEEYEVKPLLWSRRAEHVEELAS